MEKEKQIKELLSLRRQIDSKIDTEIESVLSKNENIERLKKELQYIIEVLEE